VTESVICCYEFNLPNPEWRSFKTHVLDYNGVKNNDLDGLLSTAYQTITSQVGKNHNKFLNWATLSLVHIFVCMACFFNGICFCDFYKIEWRHFIRTSANSTVSNWPYAVVSIAINVMNVLSGYELIKSLVLKQYFKDDIDDFIIMVNGRQFHWHR